MPVLAELEQALEYQQNYETKVKEAADSIRNVLHSQPKFGIVLGSGLNDLADLIEGYAWIDYKDIPNFPVPTVAGHQGELTLGNLAGVPIIGLQGRKHYYEVADEPFNTGILQVIFPVHVLAELGVQNYFVTNAAGGLNQYYNVGDIMIIKSHINLIPSPLLGRQHDFKRADSTQTWRFQPMNDAYDPKLKNLLQRAAIDAHLNSLQEPQSLYRHLHTGTYLAVTGPTYETEGECIAFRDGLKADAVGMSTSPEVIVARNRGMNVVGFSCITNKIAQDGTNATNHEEVKAVLESKETRERLTNTVKNFFRMYARSDYLPGEINFTKK